MKQIYCGFIAFFLLFCISCQPRVDQLLLLDLKNVGQFLIEYMPEKEKVRKIDSNNVYQITLSDQFGKISSEFWTKKKLESLGTRKMPSSYFDKAMKYSGTQFEGVSFLKIIRQFKFKNYEDAILLNCFDDYQGFLPVSEILKYDLYLATRIELESGSFKPIWLNPLLVLVPDGKTPPFEERFLTANIRELKFVRSSDYYAPLKNIANTSKEAGQGFEVYKNNCLFCHGLKGRGGNKGLRLLNRYSFAKKEDQKKFLSDFKNFHDKDNLDKQDIKQFVATDQLEKVIDFLSAFNKVKQNLRAFKALVNAG